MQEIGVKNPQAKLAAYGINNTKTVYWNQTPETLSQQSIERNLGELDSNGVLCISTGKFTGRSPKDKFTVVDDITENSVDWGNINHKIDVAHFDKLYQKITRYLDAKDEIWVRDAYACAHPSYRLNIRVINEEPWANLFCNDLFLRPKEEEILTAEPEWVIIQAPNFKADPAEDGTRQENFTIVNFTKKIILIGGSAYTGEMKKGIFGVLNFTLPHFRNILSMHCSANEGPDGDVALFFGLSGTGKTTLSADPNRHLIGDDEHGWADGAVFNFEGGCYAKVIDLSEEKEPDIYNAIIPGALLENIRFHEGSNVVNYEDKTITENTRVAYPIEHIKNAKHPSYGNEPKNIFFLTCDAFGVLPPISKLTKEQAMYHYISGYTAKVAGTEVGITEPQTTFSACFGAAFLPLHPTRYADLLGEKLEKHPNINVWMVNTGWSGGQYGVGKRMKLGFTRAMITAALKGELNKVNYRPHPVFGVLIPESCPDVPAEILDPKNTWHDKEAYDKAAHKLASLFIENFEKYADKASDEILSAAPKVSVDSVNP